MKRFAKIANRSKILTIFAKSPTLEAFLAYSGGIETEKWREMGQGHSKFLNNIQVDQGIFQNIVDLRSEEFF